jgi:hypothetical protein
MTPLASVQEFANYLQTTVANSAATLALGIATSRITTACNCRFEYIVDEEIVLPGGSDRLTLPGQPVHSITSITTTDYYDPIPYSQALGSAWIRAGATLYWLGNTPRVNGAPLMPYSSPIWPYEVRVVYTHGYKTIPDDVRGVCLMLAAELYTAPGGVHYESIDDYAWRRADADKTPAAMALKELKRQYGGGIYSLRSVGALQ